MADGSLIFDTKLDTDGLSSGLGKVGDIAGTAFKGIATAIGTASVAVGALAKSALDGYAAYEQLTGGVETLFKDSSGEVMKYAENAYKTAGLSANAYMETVTSFSASLIQSLDGDTAKAAQVADMAITDMSDNANKMGTDITMIQNAYNGFAKGNFTMLDNLKLGYGGTKEEMQRLLEDAEKISGVKYDLSNFADISEAIHVVQNDMGIAGATAAEAATTIEGSISSMKASWQNLVVGIADENANLDELINQFVESVAIAGQNIIPRLGIILSGIGELVSGLAPVIAEAIPNLVAEVLPTLIEAAVGLVRSLVSALPDILSALMGMLPTLISGVTNLIVELANALPDIVQVIVDALPDVIRSIVEALPIIIPALINGITEAFVILCESFDEIIEPLIEALPDIIITLVESLMENLPLVLDGIITLVMSIVEAIPQIIQGIVDALPTIISLIVSGLLKCLPQLIGGLLQVVMGIVQSLPQIFLSLIEGIINIFIGIWDGIKEAFGGEGGLGEWFKGAFGKAWEGIKNAWSSVGDWFGGIWSNIKNAFANVGTWFKDIFSNAWSKVTNSVTGWVNNLKSKFTSVLGKFKDVGKNVVEGIWQGISNGFTWIKNKISGWVGDVLSFCKKLLGIASPSKEFAWIGEMCVAGFDEGFEEFLDGSAITRSINASVNTIGANTSSAGGLAGGFNQTININKESGTPDELARAIRLESKYGLMKGVAFA